MKNLKIVATDAEMVAKHYPITYYSKESNKIKLVDAKQLNSIAIDLGLPSGNLWLSCNLCASKEEETGLFFQWGDVEGVHENEIPSNPFTWVNNKLNNHGYNCDFEYFQSIMTKVCDEENNLLPSYDAAKVIMGDLYEMPTAKDFEELFSFTDSQWVENYKNTGVNGCVFSSKKDSTKKIFMPATGVANETTVWNDNTSIALLTKTLSDKIDCAYMAGIFPLNKEVSDNLVRCFAFNIRPIIRGNKEVYLGDFHYTLSIPSDGQYVIASNDIHYSENVISRLWIDGVEHTPTLVTELTEGDHIIDISFTEEYMESGENHRKICENEYVTSATFGAVTTTTTEAYTYCPSLSTVILPDTITEIGDMAFVGCDVLDEVTIPILVNTIGKRAFENCSSLATVHYNGVDYYSKSELIGALTDNGVSVGGGAFDGTSLV